MSYSQSQLQSFAMQAAAANGVPWNVFQAQITQESGWNPVAQNGTATGIAQIQPSTAANPGYGISPANPNDPISSLNFAAQYDAALYQQTGSWTGALQSYGTLPSNLAGLSTGQQNVLTAAQAADGSAPYVDTQSGAVVSGSGNNTTVTNPLGSALTGSWGSLFQEWFARAGIIILGAALVIVGVVFLGRHEWNNA